MYLEFDLRLSKLVTLGVENVEILENCEYKKKLIGRKQPDKLIALV